MTDVTDEMVEAARHVLRRHGYAMDSGLGASALTEAISAALAARPRIAGDAVEAALDAFRTDWRTMNRDEGWQSDMSRAIEAADAARGHAMVRWRKPEEFNAWAVTTPRNKHGDIEYLATRETDPTPTAFETNGNHPSLGHGMTAWTEMPAPPPWTETAPPVASTQAEAWEPSSECRMPHICRREGGCNLLPFPCGSQPTGDAHEASVAEPAPVFTKEMAALLVNVADYVACDAADDGLRDLAGEIRGLLEAAFPDATTKDPAP